MAGRGPQSFKKRQKEQQRRERQQEKAQKREERKMQPKDNPDDELVVLTGPRLAPEFFDDLNRAEDLEDAHDQSASKA